MDGVTPGNALAALVSRKAVVWYFTFVEFRDLMSNEAFWTAVAIARTLLAMPLLSDMLVTRAIPQCGNSDTALCAISHPDSSNAVTAPH